MRSPIVFRSCRGHFWLRVFGVCLYAKDTRRHPLMFSERYGYQKTLRIGWLCIGILPRV